MLEPYFAWRLQNPDALTARRWNDELLLWHRHTGDAVLLSGLAAAVFSHLQQGSASTAELLHTLATRAPGLTTDAAGLEATLQEMMRQGLVTAHPL